MVFVFSTKNFVFCLRIISFDPRKVFVRFYAFVYIALHIVFPHELYISFTVFNKISFFLLPPFESNI